MQLERKIVPIIPFSQLQVDTRLDIDFRKNDAFKIYLFHLVYFFLVALLEFIGGTIKEMKYPLIFIIILLFIF